MDNICLLQGMVGRSSCWLLSLARIMWMSCLVLIPLIIMQILVSWGEWAAVAFPILYTVVSP